MKHITREDVYNIQMALLRNHGYFAREVDVGCNEDPVIQVINDTDRAVITIKASTDGLNWGSAGTAKNMPYCHWAQRPANPFTTTYTKGGDRTPARRGVEARPCLHARRLMSDAKSATKSAGS
jgi:hypothetical protein